MTAVMTSTPPPLVAGLPGTALNLTALAERVQRSLADAAQRERIDGLLTHLMHTRFADARVTAFLPILLHRAACECLRGELRAQAETPVR